jgi:hypothetical protein
MSIFGYVKLQSVHRDGPACSGIAPEVRYSGYLGRAPIGNERRRSFGVLSCRDPCSSKNLISVDALIIGVCLKGAFVDEIRWRMCWNMREAFAGIPLLGSSFSAMWLVLDAVRGSLVSIAERQRIYRFEPNPAASM